MSKFRRPAQLVVADPTQIEKLINKEITSHIAVADSEIAAYYERNQSNFNVPETEYHLAQIEVTPAADPGLRNLKNDDAATPEAARRKIAHRHCAVMIQVARRLQERF